MKLPRRRFWVPLLLVVGLAVCEWFHVHYHIIGWIRGDAYYRGLPTSYWRNSATAAIKGRPAWLEDFFRIGRFRPHGHANAFAIFSGEPESSEVVVQLLGDAGTDATVRAFLLSCLRDWRGEVSDELCAAARPYLDDSNDTTKLSAALFLVKWERNPVLARERLLEVSSSLSQSGSVAVRRSLAFEVAHAAKGINAVEFPTLEMVLRMLQDDGDAFVVEYVAKGRTAMRRER